MVSPPIVHYRYFGVVFSKHAWNCFGTCPSDSTKQPSILVVVGIQIGCSQGKFSSPRFSPIRILLGKMRRAVMNWRHISQTPCNKKLGFSRRADRRTGLLNQQQGSSAVGGTHACADDVTPSYNGMFILTYNTCVSLKSLDLTLSISRPFAKLFLIAIEPSTPL